MELFGGRALYGVGVVDGVHVRAVDAVFQFACSSVLRMEHDSGTRLFGGAGGVHFYDSTEGGPALALGEVVGGERAHPVLADVPSCGRVLGGDGGEIGNRLVLPGRGPGPWYL